MTRTLIVMIFLLLFAGAGRGQIYLSTTDEITISGRCLDSAGFYCTPDSVRIVVYHDGIEEYDGWFDSADDQCTAVNDMLIFSDVFGDIDDDAGDGLYEVMAGFFEDDGDLYYWKTFWAYIGVDMSELGAVSDSIEAWDDEVARINNIGDSIDIYDLRFDSIMAALSDAGMARKIWDEDTTGHYNPSSYGFEAVRIGATRGELADTLIKTGMVTYSGGADSTLMLKRCVIDNDAGTAALAITNSGTGDAVALSASGSGSGLLAASVSGDDIRGDITGTLDTVSYVKDGNISSETDTALIKVCGQNNPDIFYGPTASGSGAKTYTIYIADTTGGDTVLTPHVIVSAYSLSGVLQAGMSTDSYGKVVYSTDLDSLMVVASRRNFFADPDTIGVIETGQVDTLFGYHGTVPSSGSPDLCRLYGFLYDVSGNPDTGAAVAAWLPGGVCLSDSTIISPFKVEGSSDSTGYFYLDLIPSVKLVPDTTRYEITIRRSDGTILRERVIVPDEESWLLAW
jgi:hypothetical protein